VDTVPAGTIFTYVLLALLALFVVTVIVRSVRIVPP
jgi:hypothetical protein